MKIIKNNKILFEGSSFLERKKYIELILKYQMEKSPFYYPRYHLKENN